jgi:hypothetical protein
LTAGAAAQGVERGGTGRGTAAQLAALSAVIPSPMENPMCWEMDYRWLAEQKKAEETKARQEQRSEVIEKLLNEANKQPEKSDEAPAKEIIPAK